MSKRMWGVFDGEHCVAAFMWRVAARNWIESDNESREVMRPVTVTYQTQKKGKRK